MYPESDLNGQLGLFEMNHTDNMTVDFDEEYDAHYDREPRAKIPQAEFQDSETEWRTAQKYIPVERLENIHLLSCIHMMERKSIKDYDPVPTKLYKRMIKEAKKRKLIKR